MKPKSPRIEILVLKGSMKILAKSVCKEGWLYGTNFPRDICGSTLNRFASLGKCKCFERRRMG